MAAAAAEAAAAATATAMAVAVGVAMASEFLKAAHCIALRRDEWTGGAGGFDDSIRPGTSRFRPSVVRSLTT